MSFTSRLLVSFDRDSCKRWTSQEEAQGLVTWDSCKQPIREHIEDAPRLIILRSDTFRWHKWNSLRYQYKHIYIHIYTLYTSVYKVVDLCWCPDCAALPKPSQSLTTPPPPLGLSVTVPDQLLHTCRLQPVIFKGQWPDSSMIKVINDQSDQWSAAVTTAEMKTSDVTDDFSLWCYLVPTNLDYLTWYH